MFEHLARKVMSFIALSILVCADVAEAVPTAHLILDSQPGDFIGAGGHFDITYTSQVSSPIFAHILRSVGGSPALLDFSMGTVTSGRDNTFASLTFGTDQLGIPIQPGAYPNAQRASFASPGHPGLDVSFQNRGSNTLTGSFTVDFVTFSSSQSIETFGAHFEQHSEGAVPALFGSFTYNASPVPEPASWHFLGLGLVGLWAIKKRMQQRAPSKG